MEQISNQDIIITGLQSWDIEIGSNCKNIAIEFSKKNRVLYVCSPLDRFSLIRNRNKTNGKAKANLQEVKENLWVLYPECIIESISRLPVNFMFDVINKHNNKLLAKEIEKAITKLAFSNYIHFCDSDMFRSFYLKELLKPQLYIYYTRDNLMAVKYWQTQGNRIEPLHMEKADIVMANSSYLAKLALSHNRESYFVGQGCDLSAFKPKNGYHIPNDMAAIKQPIIGYIGALKTLRLDLSVLEYIADTKPEWSIVLVGPEDDDFKASKLHCKSNVWFLGRKDEKELPKYLNYFNVAINPQLINEITIGNYPRKIDEYLAMGKPVVGTQTEAMEYFKDFVSLAKNKEEWVKCIDFELSNDTAQLHKQRTNFACQHTWKKNVEQIYNHITKRVLS